VADIAAGLTRLPDWDVEHFTAELRQLDAAVNDRDEDRWDDIR
jgi:hypothetical protein